MRRAPVIVSLLAAISGAVVVLMHWCQYMTAWRRCWECYPTNFMLYWTHEARYQVWSTPPDYWRDLARGVPSDVEILILLTLFAGGMFVALTGKESLVNRLKSASTFCFRAALIVIVLGVGASARGLSEGLARSREVTGRVTVWDLYPLVSGPPATIRITAVVAGASVSLALLLLVLAFLSTFQPIRRGRTHE